MIKLTNIVSEKRVPHLLKDYYLTIDGDLRLGDTPISIEQFVESTNINVTLKTLMAVTYHDFNLPPNYWTKLNVMSSNETVSPENLVIGLHESVPSLEYPGFFIIPYYSNYVISECGILIKKSNGEVIQASRGPLGYYTYRMTDDSGSTQNRLRHRIKCMAFKPYPFDFEDLDINHIDGIPGNDDLSNLEWVSRSGNMDHAYRLGLRSDNKPVEVKDVLSNRVYIFGSCNEAGRFFDVVATTITNRCRTNGYKDFNGLQFRYHKPGEPWPVTELKQDYEVRLLDGTVVKCGAQEAARLSGVTRTSLHRLIREGRNETSSGVVVSKLTKVPSN